MPSANSRARPVQAAAGVTAMVALLAFAGLVAARQEPPPADSPGAPGVAAQPVAPGAPSQPATPGTPAPPGAAATPAGAPGQSATPGTPAPPGAAATPAAAPGQPGQPGDETYVPPPTPPSRSIDPLGTRLVNVTTPVTTGSRGLELLITHRFRLPIQQGSSSDLYGLDSGADVGLGMTAGIGGNVDFSFYRSSFEADYELAGKVLVLRQGPHVPLSLAVRGGVDLPGIAGAVPHTRPLAQLLLSTRIAPGFNLLVSPSWVSDTPTLHNAYNVPIGLTFPVPGQVLIELEGIPPNRSLHGSQTAWHAAMSKQVGWHIFKIILGNSRATTLDQMLGGDSETGFRNRDVRLGFNLIRYFFY